jgi:hypothetical protein
MPHNLTLKFRKEARLWKQLQQKPLSAIRAVGEAVVSLKARAPDDRIHRSGLLRLPKVTNQQHDRPPSLDLRCCAQDLLQLPLTRTENHPGRPMMRS